MSRRVRARRKSESQRKMLGVGLAVVILAVLILGLAKSSFSFGAEGCGTREIDPERSGYCLTNSRDFDELVVVVGNTQNSPKPELDFGDGELREILAGVFYNAERGDSPAISIVSAAGGNNVVEFTSKYKPAQNIRSSNGALRKLGNDLSRILETPATAAGADYLAGILEAANLISTSAKHPLILVVGSGYSDSGVLNFAQDDLFERYWQNEENISALLARDRSTQRSSLEGVAVYWYNLGDTVAPQVNMNKSKDDTQAIYEMALTALGAKEINLRNYSGVKSDAAAVDSPYSVMPTFVEELEAGDSFNVNENVGQFEPDRDILVNETEAEKRLRNFAQRFNNNGELKMRLTGYVAYCLENEDLGLARANTIKRVLTKLGVDEQKILVAGRRGSPPRYEKEEYTCDSDLPMTERRTVHIEIIEE